MRATISGWPETSELFWLLCCLMLARTDRLFREVTLECVSPEVVRDGTLIAPTAVRAAIEAAATAQGLAWSAITLDRARSHLLAALKDFGVLRGSATKQTVRPRPGSPTVLFGARLARLEGLTDRQVLQAQWFRMLGLGTDQVVELLYAATRDGTLGFRQQADIVELRLPALEPGESRELSTEVARPHPAPLGDFNRVPPERLLTAVNAPNQPPPRSGTGFGGILNLFRRGRPARSSGRDLAGRATLAPDLSDLLGRGQPHWAGNINVFVGNRPVERHLSKALRVFPGRANLAMFVVGDPGKRDAYSFELVGLEPDWKAVLYDMKNNQGLLVNPSAVPIEETQWVESDGGLMLMLATHPPSDCRTGNLEVHVTRQSSRKTAVVEFDLDPTAQGPGCYFM